MPPLQHVLQYSYYCDWHSGHHHSDCDVTVIQLTSDATAWQGLARAARRNLPIQVLARPWPGQPGSESLLL